jgi:hypothetical protein
VQTASWFTYLGPGRIGISRGTPRGARAGFRLFRALCPTSEMLRRKHYSQEEYDLAILANLDPQETWEELHGLAGDAEPVLLCWERPPFIAPHNLCHRRWVAEWFERTLGHRVEEYSKAPSLI